MVSEIAMFYCKSDMTSSWFLRQGAPHAILHDGFWKGDPNFISMFNRHFFVYLERFRRNSTFSIWLGFPYCGRNFGGLEAKWTPKRQLIEKHLLGGHFFTPNCVFWAIGLEIISIRLAYAGAQKRQAGRKTIHKKCIFHVCVERPLTGGFQPNLAHLFVSRT